MQQTILKDNSQFKVSVVVIRVDKWCAKRTTPCLTAYREERSDEWCAEDKH